MGWISGKPADVPSLERRAVQVSAWQGALSWVLAVQFCLVMGSGLSALNSVSSPVWTALSRPDQGGTLGGSMGDSWASHCSIVYLKQACCLSLT